MHTYFKRCWMALAFFSLTLLSACGGGTSDASSLDTRLYTVEAGQGTFTPTATAGEYRLRTRQLAEQVTWFNDRPLRDSGLQTLSAFMGEVWPAYFAGQRPSAGVSVRDAEGVLYLLSAQVVDARLDTDAGEMEWTLRTPFKPALTPYGAVVLYLDDKGATQDDDDAQVFLHTAAHAHFEPLGDGVRQRLVLDFPLPEVLGLTVSPQYNAVTEPLAYFVNTSWPQGFSRSAPNASITIEQANGQRETLALMLESPQWDAKADRLTYIATPLPGHAVGHQQGPATMFIDSWEDTEDQTIYVVVMNLEEMYSIWPADRELPLGWRLEGFSGLKPACIEHMKNVWTDMRPLSLRKKMQEMERQQNPFGRF